MNYKLNKILNIVEITLVFLVIISLFILANISLSGLKSQYQVLRNMLLIISMISEVGIISIELILFIVLKRNIKFIYIAYIIGEFLLAILINVYFSFSGLLVIGIFSLVKTILRLKYISKIYNRTYFRRYCKLFNIKLSTAKPKKRKTTRRKQVGKRTTAHTGRQIKSYA